jgi:molecular chaperone HtpG
VLQVSNGIVFQVETDRVLKILTRDIYDSPLALLRENVQNAYDAVRMRFAPSGKLRKGGRIDVTLKGDTLTILDNGIGMTERVLRDNFWRAGSSGKNSAQAKRAGVVGTFGIGAMANFGVCRSLQVETRTEEGEDLLISVADRRSLKIAEECISFDRLSSDRDVGTSLTVVLDENSLISPQKAEAYLRPYVGMLPVPVYFNGKLISQRNIETLLNTGSRSFKPLGSINVRSGVGIFVANCEVLSDRNGQVLVKVSNVTLGGDKVDGSLALLQSGGQLMGLRSSFGLAPAPSVGPYQFGGWANLSFLQPTAGREALSRESIEHIGQLVSCAEYAASSELSKTEFADRNAAFIQWVYARDKFEFANKITIHVLPEDKDIALGEIKKHVGGKTAQYYAGSDRHTIDTFTNEGSCLFQISQNSQRRSIQLHYLKKLSISGVPDSVQVTRIYQPPEITPSEASVLLRIAQILRDDYLIPDVEAFLVDMSHGVSVLPEKVGEQLRIQMARDSTVFPPAIEVREKAPEVFGQFMKDFVRNHIYLRVQQYVPSSTRGGVDALRKTLLRNRELYRYEDSELGDLEGVLGEYLSGTKDLGEVVRNVQSGGFRYVGGGGQRQKVSSEQVAPLESVVPDVVESPVVEQRSDGAEFDARPPILREDLSSEMKILTTDENYPQLNGFGTFLGLSDRLMRTESPFFRTPHTTRVIWGGHRVIYIFTNVTGELSLYYDIELRDPISSEKAGGGAFATTTLVTAKRIFVPVPADLADEFRVETGSREFFVRFDLLGGDFDTKLAE